MTLELNVFMGVVDVDVCDLVRRIESISHCCLNILIIVVGA